jgi:hypothetical protein
MTAMTTKGTTLAFLFANAMDVWKHSDSTKAGLGGSSDGCITDV